MLGKELYLDGVHGERYLDALAGLFAVQIGYSFGEEVGEAAAAQMRELPFYANWSCAHPRAIELAAELAALAPGDLNRVLFMRRERLVECVAEHEERFRATLSAFLDLRSPASSATCWRTLGGGSAEGLGEPDAGGGAGARARRRALLASS